MLWLGCVLPARQASGEIQHAVTSLLVAGCARYPDRVCLPDNVLPGPESPLREPGGRGPAGRIGMISGACWETLSE